jgi:hypothetical protein
LAQKISIWQRGFWKSYWVAIRRSGKDKRARLAAISVSGAIVYVVLYALAVFALPFRDGASAGWFQLVFNGFAVASGIMAAILLRRAYRRDDELLNISITGRNPVVNHARGVAPEVRAYLEERAGIVASLLARGASEIYLQHAAVAAGAAVVTRQIQNGFLRESGLWDRMEASERDLASAADGNWTAEQRSEVAKWCEQLRLLRWTLGLDTELEALAHFPEVNFLLTREFLKEKKILRATKTLLEASDLRGERDTALGYLARIVAELEARGLIRVGGETWMKELRAKSLGPSVDFLAGAKTIGELGDDSLRFFGAVAGARERYASWLVETLGAVDVTAFSVWSIAAE